MVEVEPGTPSTSGGALGYLVEKGPNSRRTHFCCACSMPAATFGRLYPCLHAFCLTCASDMDGCFV